MTTATSAFYEALEKGAAGERLSFEEGCALLEGDDLTGDADRRADVVAVFGFFDDDEVGGGFGRFGADVGEGVGNVVVPTGDEGERGNQSTGD